MRNRYREAIDVQDACNPSGVALSLHKMCCVVSREGNGTDGVRRDPAVRLFVAKLADLCGLEYDWPRDAQAECERLSCE